MVFGILTLMICLVLLLQFLARKRGWVKLNHILKKLHKPAGAAVPVAVVLHLLFTYDVWDTRAHMVVATGIAAGAVLVFMTIGYLLRKKYAKHWMRLHLAGAVTACILIILHIGSYYMDFFQYNGNIASIKIEGVNAQELDDGRYIGEYDAGYIYVSVCVVVESGHIAEIRILEHQNERGAPAEAIIQNIISEQNTAVDAVSGATNSSLVIIKAAENALLNGKAQ